MEKWNNLAFFDPTGSNPGAGNRPGRVASQADHIEVVKILLEDVRVDPSADNNSAVMLALENNHMDIVKVLIIKSAKVAMPF